MVRLVDLSQPFSHTSPLWPYCPDISISRMHYHARNGVFTQWISAPMHVSTHADAPVHVIAGELYTDECPLDWYYGTGVIVDIPKGRFGNITADDLENATPKIEKGDIVIIHTHMHAKYADDQEYFGYSPGLVRSAGEWLVAKGVKAVGVDQQALDHPLSTAIGPHGPGGPLLPDVNAAYERETGRKVIDDYPEWEPVHRLLLGNHIMGFENVGGDIDEVLGMRCIISGFPIRWVKGDGSMVRLVAILDD